VSGDKGVDQAGVRVDRRPVAEDDRAFLLNLYASTRATEMAMVPWTEEQKQAFVESQFAAQLRGYADTYPDAVHEILSVSGELVGRVYLSREAERLQILDITIAPAARNRGIGTRVLREILAEADDAHKAVSVYVEPYNPSLRLFTRLGFAVASQEEFQLLLEKPAVGSELLNHKIES
jgi:ribosomal protein S18 acetylase RimI-like enzyme